MARYLVCRLDAIKPDGRMRTSEFFPMEVVTDPDGPTMTYEDIVRKAFERIWANKHSGRYDYAEQYIGYHAYLVVPLNDAAVVSFKKPVKYEVDTRPYKSMGPVSSNTEMESGY